MGRGDNRKARKTIQRAGQRRKKARLARRATAVKAARQVSRQKAKA